jgi:RNA polymerase sigma-70 factor (ECF subfamily)
MKRLEEDDFNQAFKDVFYAHYEGLCLYAKSYVKKEELAEEVVSDVFVKLWKKRQLLNQIKYLDKYLYTATRNQAINYLKNKQNTKFAPIEESSLDHSIYAHNPEHILMLEELKKVLDNAIEQLPPVCQTTFKLVREKGLTYKQAADHLKVSVFTVQTQISRAIRKLRQQMNAYLDDNPPKK